MQIHRTRFIQMTIAVLSLAMGVSVYSSPAMAGSERIVTLDEAIRLALEHNPLLSAAQQDLLGAEAEKRLARSALLPKLDLSETYLRTDNAVSAFGSLLNQANFTSDDFALDRLNHPDPLNNFRSAITLTQPIYNGGRESLGLRLAGIGQEIAQSRFETMKRRVIFNVTEAYYRLLLAKEQFRVSEEAQQIAEADLRQIRTRYEQGLVVKSDFLWAEVQLADVKEKSIRAENGVRLARITLKNAIGLSKEVEIGGDLENSPITLPELESLKEEAKRSRPDYRALRRELDRAKTEVELARSAFLPNFNLQGTYELNHRTVASDGSDSYTVLALFSMNLFNGLGDQAKVSKAKAQLEKLRSLLVEQTRGIEHEVTEAYLSLAEARERLKVREGTVTQAEENLRIVRNRYQTGITTLLDLLTAEYLLTQAKTARIQALYDSRVALARLDLSTGRLWRSHGMEESR